MKTLRIHIVLVLAACLLSEYSLASLRTEEQNIIIKPSNRITKEDVEMAAEDLTGSSLNQLCVSYNEPINQMGEPILPFKHSPKAAELRKNAADGYTQLFQDYFITSDSLVTRLLDLKALAEKVFGFAAGLRLKEAPKLFTLDHHLYCEKISDDMVKANSSSTDQDKYLQMKKAMYNNCREESFGRANVYKNEVILAQNILEHKNGLGSDFAYLHELCHVQYPAISDSTYEEIFCDAVALKWLKKSNPNLSNSEISTAVATMLEPDNLFKEILLLRSQLPKYCL